MDLFSWQFQHSLIMSTVKQNHNHDMFDIYYLIVPK